MKNLRVSIKAILLAFITLVSTAGFTMAADNAASAEIRAMAIKERVYELKAMDYGHMSRKEKKEVRAEVKELKKELQAMHPNTYVYIGGGTLILILILILLLL
ncbi:MAG: hypothetical protein KF744_07255 [Taibaiella sp.]|nr:hypothetical protein [Taibaiella sp.]